MKYLSVQNKRSVVAGLLVLAFSIPSACDRQTEEEAEVSVAPTRSEGVNVRIQRLLDSPIITPQLHSSIGENIQGPSLIRVPDWVEAPLGKYYLYFADHKGTYIRLAYADIPEGPWTIYAPGSLQIADSHFLMFMSMR
jgi:hypothetical protein